MSDPNSEANGSMHPMTAEALDARVSVVERRQDELKGLLISIAEEQSRQGKQQSRIAEALKIDSSADGPPPDITGQIRALQAEDIVIKQRIEKAQGTYDAALAIAGKAAKIGGAIVGGLSALTVAVWALTRVLEKLVGP